MDEKPIEGAKEEAKPKITRSRARHERRKRLIDARRAAQKDSDPSTLSKSPERSNGIESVSKSKARRLRKKNKIEDEANSATNSENNTGSASPASRITECPRKTVCVDVGTPETKPKHDKDSAAIRNDRIESKVPKKNFESTKKTAATEHELLENEKNLQISESLRPTSTYFTTSLSSVSPQIPNDIISESNFIITNDTRVIDVSYETNVITFENDEISCQYEKTNISPKTVSRESESYDDASSSNLNTSNTNQTTKTFTTFTTMSSDGKMNSQEKTREQIKAEREAKKAAKAASKGKGKKSEIPEKITEPTSNAIETLDGAKYDEVDGEILSMGSQLTISGSTKKSDIVVAEAKTKAELRAERRAKQEAQRAAKQGATVEISKPKQTKPIREIAKIVETPTKLDDTTKKIVKRTNVRENAHEVNLFKHLYHEREQSLIKVPTVNSNLHPAIVRLGVQYANKVIVGSNARCVALLAAVKQLVNDFERPSQADFTRGLEASLQESSAYLHHCRPIAVSMQNALRHLKWQMTQLHATTSDEEAKTKLGHAIDTYIQEQIQLADKAISITIQTKISNGDVILTYGFSSLINKILCDAHDAGRQFRVVVVDGRPWLEGKEQVRRLAKHGLECSYVLINALSFIMPGVSKVFLGAHAILANGAVMSRVGTAQVALMAKAFNVPVLVACETHKTCERVQTDSIVYNEIADADELTQNLMGNSIKTSLINWRSKKSLNLLNLTYDVTPADLVTAVVTELAILPCTSVPVILRIKPSEI